MSPDGRFAIFTSTASDLVAGVTDTNSGADVFLRDIQAGTTAILSVDADGNALGTLANTALSAFVFSPDSTRLLFRTQAANIVAGLADTNNAPDWFVRELLDRDDVVRDDQRRRHLDGERDELHARAARLQPRQLEPRIHQPRRRSRRGRERPDRARSLSSRFRRRHDLPRQCHRAAERHPA